MKECLRSFVKQNGQGVWGFGVAYAKHISLIGPIGPIRCPREPVVTPERVLQTTAQKSRTTPSTRTICERRTLNLLKPNLRAIDLGSALDKELP
jgi:hypothetical protein